jgi:hypothetical protein
MLYMKVKQRKNNRTTYILASFAFEEERTSVGSQGLTMQHKDLENTYFLPTERLSPDK